jgi:hypothetical protein
MKRAMLCVAALSLTACIDFEAIFDAVDAGALPSREDDAGFHVDSGLPRNEVDAGVADAGATDAGATDAGVADAGMTDAGCGQAFCFVASLLAGNSVTGAVFDVAGEPTLFGDYGNSSSAFRATRSGSMFVAQQLPFISGAERLRSVDGLAVISSNDFWLVGGYQIARFVQGAATEVNGTRCGFSQNVDWSGVVANGSDEAWMYGINSGLCHWTRTGGFQQFIAPAPLRSYSSGALFPDGQVWLGDDSGHVRAWSQLGIAVDTQLRDGTSPTTVRFLRRFGDVVWAASGFDFPSVLKPGSSWESVPTAAAGVRAVWWSGPNDIWVATGWCSEGKPMTHRTTVTRRIFDSGGDGQRCLAYFGYSVAHRSRTATMMSRGL